MAAFDYRMALARGLVPPIKEAQQGILKSAGGDNVFKSEAWWNEQYDKTIDQGISETKQRTEYLRSPGAYNFNNQPNYWAPVDTNSIMNSRPNAVSRGIFGGGFQGPTTRTVNYQEQRDLTQAELDSIVSDQKGQIAKTKREASQEDNKTKRNKRRGGGGLLSKAKPIEVKGLATAMPDLGVMSLYGSDSTLGVK
tara:strand:+ start:1268 stop:1852 length:585 start_codon:yes stop_codon:yes gene_type:complete